MGISSSLWWSQLRAVLPAAASIVVEPPKSGRLDKVKHSQGVSTRNSTADSVSTPFGSENEMIPLMSATAYTLAYRGSGLPPACLPIESVAALVSLVELSDDEVPELSLSDGVCVESLDEASLDVESLELDSMVVVPLADVVVLTEDESMSVESPSFVVVVTTLELTSRLDDSELVDVVDVFGSVVSVASVVVKSSHVPSKHSIGSHTSSLQSAPAARIAKKDSEHRVTTRARRLTRALALGRRVVRAKEEWLEACADSLRPCDALDGGRDKKVIIARILFCFLSNRRESEESYIDAQHQAKLICS